MPTQFPTHQARQRILAAHINAIQDAINRAELAIEALQAGEAGHEHPFVPHTHEFTLPEHEHPHEHELPAHEHELIPHEHPHEHDSGGTVAAPEPVVVSFSQSAAYYIAPATVTLDVDLEAGTQSVAYAVKSGDTFTTATLPVTLQRGDVLRITAIGTGWKALALKRVV